MRHYRRNSRTSSGMTPGADSLAVQLKLAARQADAGDVRSAVGALMSAAHDFGFMHANGSLSGRDVVEISDLLNEILYSRIYPNIQ